MSENRYSVVSLFSGAMGLDIGLESAGRFTVRACVETQPAFAETIRLNQFQGRLPRDLKLFQRDITKVAPEEILEATRLEPGELHLLSGGPPCQSFSTVGKRGTVEDPRGTLLWDFLRFIRVLRPKFFLMENVRGLLSAALHHRPIAQRPEKGGPPLAPDEEPGSVIRMFAEDLQALPDAKYHMDCFEVNAVNYGAPQLRERALFIGNRYNAVVDFPDPTHSPADKPEIQERFDFEVASCSLLRWRTLGDAIAGLHEDRRTIMDFSPRKKRYLSMVPPGANWRSLPVEIQKESMGVAWLAKGGRSGWWRRLSFDLPCPTLVTMPNHASTALCHPAEVRALTLREYALIQEFPAEWQFCGTPSEQYAQVGNAVPVRLGNVAGQVLALELDRLAERNWTPYKKAPDSYRIIYVQSHIRTRQWFKDGETFVWDDGNESNPAYRKAKTQRRVRTLEGI